MQTTAAPVRILGTCLTISIHRLHAKTFADITDLHVFPGEKGTTFVIDVCHSIAQNVPVPGYHPEGMYEFKIDFNRDAVEELTYRFTFDARDADGKQRRTSAKLNG